MGEQLSKRWGTPKYADPDYLDDPEGDYKNLKIFKGSRELVAYTVKLDPVDFYMVRSVVFFSNAGEVSANLGGRRVYLGDLILNDGVVDGSFEFINGDRRDYRRENLIRTMG